MSRCVYISRNVFKPTIILDITENHCNMQREFELRKVLPDELASICFEYVNPARVVYNHVVEGLRLGFDKINSMRGRSDGDGWIAYWRLKTELELIDNSAVRMIAWCANKEVSPYDLFGKECPCDSCAGGPLSWTRSKKCIAEMRVSLYLL